MYLVLSKANRTLKSEDLCHVCMSFNSLMFRLRGDMYNVYIDLGWISADGHEFVEWEGIILTWSLSLVLLPKTETSNALRRFCYCWVFSVVIDPFPNKSYSDLFLFCSSWVWFSLWFKIQVCITASLKSMTHSILT